MITSKDLNQFQNRCLQIGYNRARIDFTNNIKSILESMKTEKWSAEQVIQQLYEDVLNSEYVLENWED